MGTGIDFINIRKKFKKDEKNMDDVLYLLLGIIAVAGEMASLYKIIKKIYGKGSTVLIGRIIAIYVGGGLKKTYTPVVEVSINGNIEKIIAKDNMSMKEKYSLNDNVELYYNKSVKKCPVLIKKDYSSIIYALIILMLGLGIIICVILDVLQNGFGKGYTSIHPWM